MNSEEFRKSIKEISSKFVSKNGNQIRIWYSIVEKVTNNRIYPYHLSGLRWGVQEITADKIDLIKIKNYKIVYNSNKAGNQLYFFSNMFRKIQLKLSQLEKNGDIKFVVDLL